MAEKFERDFTEGLTRITTGCQYCAVGCGYNAFLTPGPDAPARIEDAPRFITPAMQPARTDPADPDTTGKIYYKGNPVRAAVAPDVRCDLNKGNHSVRGASQGQNLVAYDGGAAVGASTRDRLISPWVRLDSGTWREIDWDTLEQVMAALVISATDMRKQGDKVAINNPRGLGVKLYEYQYLENTYAATKLFYSAVGTPNVAYHDRPSAAGSSPGLKDAGLRPHDFAYEDTAASDLIIMIGMNPYENQSVFFMQYCQGKEIVVIDPRHTATADYAAKTGGLHIQPMRLGADSRLIYAIARSLIERWEAKNPGQDFPTLPPIGDRQDLIQEAGNSSEAKRKASRARSFAEFRQFLDNGKNNSAEVYDLEEAMTAARLSDENRQELDRLLDRLINYESTALVDQPRVAILYEKGVIWGFNYHNTAALASLGVLLGAGTETGRILGRVGGHQKGWAERVDPLEGFDDPDLGTADKSKRYPTHNATDLYSDDHLKDAFGTNDGRDYIKPKHNLDHHVFGPLKTPQDPHERLGSVARPPPAPKDDDGQDTGHRTTGRIRLPNGLETDEDPDVSLLWIIGGNYLGQTNDVAWKRRKLHERMKAGRPVNPRRPRTTAVDDIVDALTRRMRDGGLVCIHQDIFPNPTTECCDIVIPAAGWGEESFCRYNAQRRLKLYERFQDMPFHSHDARRPGEDPYDYISDFAHSPKPDWMIFSRIAKRIDARLGTDVFTPSFDWVDSAQLADEMAAESHRASAGGLGLAALLEFAEAQHPEIPEHKRVHTLLGASSDPSNTNAETAYLRENYKVSPLRNGDTSEPDLGSGVYTNGIASNGVFVPLTTRQTAAGATELVAHLSVRPKAPYFFVVADWEDIEPAFNRINGIADDDGWRARGGVLVTNGRVNHLWNNMFHHLRNDYVNDRYPEDLPGTIIEISPTWAEAQADPIANGDTVRISGATLPPDHPGPNDAQDGERDYRDIVYGVASLQESVPPGMAFLMFSYPVSEGRHAFSFNFNGYVNNLTDGYCDGINPIAALKYGHGILSKVPAEQAGFAGGKFTSAKRPGPLYDQRNVIAPEAPFTNRDDWQMRELIVQKGLPRAQRHNADGRPDTFTRPDDLLRDLKSGLAERFKQNLPIMKWPIFGELVIDEWHGSQKDFAEAWAAAQIGDDGGGTGNGSQGNTGGGTMTGFARVQEILDQSVGGPDGSGGFFHGAFWRDTDRDSFVALSFAQLPIVALGDGAGSNLVNALKGEAPFGSDQGVPGASFRRMPAGLPPVPPEQIAEIETWIDNGAPAEAPDAQPELALHEIHLLPHLALARLGSSPSPIDNYEVVHDPSGGFSDLRPAETLQLDTATGAIVAATTPAAVRFKDEAGRVKPVSPFLEVWARIGDDQNLVPLTKDHLATLGVSSANLTWTVRLGNLKAFRRTGDPGDRITFDRDITGHGREILNARSPNFKSDNFISLGTFQYVRPTDDFPEIRARFTPATGFVFGHTADNNVPSERAVYDRSRGVWDDHEDQNQFGSPTPRARLTTAPGGIYARDNNLQNLGYLDDTCDGLITVSLSVGDTTHTATARVSSGPPDYAPDSFPVRSFSDDLKQMVSGPVPDTVSVKETIEVVRKALETVRLMNTETQNLQNPWWETTWQNRPADQRPFDAAEAGYDHAVRRHRDILASLKGLRSPPSSPERSAAVTSLRTVGEILRQYTQASSYAEAQVRLMPAIMRGGDGEMLALTRRQRNIILRAVEQFAAGGGGDPSPAAAMTRLVDALALPFAGLHAAVTLPDGRTLDQLFSSTPDLLNHLMTGVASGAFAERDGLLGDRLVVAGDPDNSAFFKMITNPGHPMNGQFAQYADAVNGDNGVDVVRKWIAALPDVPVG